MTEYITKEQAYNSVDERIDELKDDKEFNIVKEICISGVKKYISAIPTADVVERKKIDEAIEEMKALVDPKNTILEFDEKMGVKTAMNILVRSIRKGRLRNDQK